ncbi:MULTISPECIES: GDYXXLXY domain-containing protein [Hyphomicrobiales]|jgi:uncharacterized membrane-anchored protein|uniref:GDYXXLXY domain-containing protein n=1 Tax=Bosea massiliensis TaxID=151419 RepID=A0ABW0PAS9_9HYPH|nr:MULTISPECIES: GDYXXLXY domain-containing protein [Hyphomicrobiales]
MTPSVPRLPSADALLAQVPLIGRMLAAMLLLCSALLALVESRAAILRGGTEIRLRTVPVDPRDLFRGDYVVLAYDISRVTSGKLVGDKRLRRGDKLYVQVANGSDGFAELRSVSTQRPAGTEPVLIARVVALPGCRGDGTAFDCSGPDARIHLAYGLESYFVPQSEGRRIETTPKARIEVVAAVAGDGTAAIKRLLIDGKLVYAEPPY